MVSKGFNIVIAVLCIGELGDDVYNVLEVLSSKFSGFAQHLISDAVH